MSTKEEELIKSMSLDESTKLSIKNANDILKSIPQDTLKEMAKMEINYDLLKNYGSLHVKKITPYFETEEYKSRMKEFEESEKKIAQDREDFYNNTRTIAESTVASAKHTEKIEETNAQLVELNKMLFDKNKMLFDKIDNVSNSLNNLTDEFIDRLRVNQTINFSNGEKLQEMIDILKNPSDETVFDKFKELPPQVIIGLVLQAAIKISGLG
ncbi:hypothetical protein [Romboutsia lituseburensis]|uniref:hypothetical protein n=1 Tax=Romboutsia lituseburensis TaxID=1537 RepID=UPI0022EAF77B|nr:hypothetical protein [Romboutsia lituseburensis]